MFANRLKPWLPDLINIEQSAFVEDGGEYGLGWAGPLLNSMINSYSVDFQFLEPRIDPIKLGTKD